MYYAYLIDRVKINSDEPQLYGTQLEINMDSTSYEPKPTIDLQNLNKRRTEMELVPIEEYIKTMNEKYYGTLKRKEE